VYFFCILQWPDNVNMKRMFELRTEITDLYYAARKLQILCMSTQSHNNVKIYKQRAFFPSKCNQLAKKPLPIVCVTYLTWKHEWIKRLSWIEGWEHPVLSDFGRFWLEVAQVGHKVAQFFKFEFLNQILHDMKRVISPRAIQHSSKRKKCNAKKILYNI
jgi:hypothetical protein